MASSQVAREPAIERHDLALRLVLIVAAGLLIALPILLLLGAKVSPVAVVNESLGYRYFNSWRVLEGERGLIFIVQGQAPGLVQHFVVLFLDAIGVPDTDLRARLDLFTYVFLGINTALSVVFVALAAFDGRLYWTDRLTVAMAPLWATYSSQGALSLAIRPDYLAFEAMLSAAAALIFLRLWRESGSRFGMLTIAALGVFAGFLAATKIGVFWTGVLAALPALLADRRIVQIVARTVCFGVVAVGVFAVTTLAFYLFDLSILPEFLTRWLAFVSNPGGEDRFWESVFSPGSPAANPSADYGYARLLLPLWLVAVLLGAVSAWLHASSRGWQRLAPVAILLLALWQAVGLVVRPAGTTLYEVALFAVVSGGCALATVEQPRWRTLAASTFLGLLSVHCVVSGIINGPIILPIIALRDDGEAAWEAHAWLASQGQPVVAYIPDNMYTAGSVEEALLKGMSDLPTWNITSGKPLLDRIAPGFTFTQTLDHVAPGTTLFWMDIDGELSLAEQNPALKAAVGSALATGSPRCRRWKMDAYPWWRRTMIGCRGDG